MAIFDDARNLVCELVAIESVNPDLVPGGSGETGIARFVAGWLEAAGAEVEIVETVEGRPSVAGVVRGSGGGGSLMLNAHMDTVGAGGMIRPFEPVVSDGRVYGRGSYDMKGSLAAIMLAAREARRLRLKGDLIVTAVADEEVASLGTSAILDRFRADAAIVTEPTELRLCLAHKGFVWLEVETTGVAAHGSRADLGVDAIAAMGPILSGIAGLARRLAEGPAHPLLGHPSIHASLVEGGQEMSTYPARCVARLERRTVPGEGTALVTRQVESLSESGAAAVRVLLERQPSDVSRDLPVARSVSEAAGNPEVIGVPYWMDMALLNSAGIPCVAYGPAGEGEHADVEWVDIASIERCVEVYLGAAERLTRSTRAGF
ncbi:MAG TPA: M20/M25/M40 family metallo-hydrolase [Candidatus Dormibacteraeota bacterium]|nr:M20/M25/M40 family metallo-hydrolase [Candidatus Dormibacteraeota bacterium]